jgi:hypothetical protein
MRRNGFVSLAFVSTCVFLGCVAVAPAQEGPWPADVPGFQAPAPGEHPRLLFRKKDLPALRTFAKTDEGKAILERLRKCLNGSDGESMPTSFNPEKGPITQDGSGDFAVKAPLGTYTFSHMAGFGLLYQLTGEKKYADLGEQCFEKALEGYRDRDRRYAFQAPFGALRAGPALGWTALGYDLCYDGWDEEFRVKVTRALANYDEGGKRNEINLAGLTKGTMPAFSNHFGMQAGGATLALLALKSDPGVDAKKIDDLLALAQKSMIRELTEGFGDGGFFAEGDGTGSMSSHIAFLTALQAWKNAGGKDFVTPRANASWTALKYIFLTVPRAGTMDFWPKRGGYPQNIWSREGLSGAGYFAFPFGVLPDDEKAALLWFYNHHLADRDAKAGTPFDTSNPYPHLAVCAFINWPRQVKEKNPGDVLPHAYRDSKWGFYACRNRWKDENDVVVSVLTRNVKGYIKADADGGLAVAGLGKKFKWGKVRGDVADWQAGADGSMVLTLGDGTSHAVDLSRASGTDAMLVSTGPADGVKVRLGDVTLTFKFLTNGADPSPRVESDRVIVAGQSVTLQNGRIILGKTAGPVRGLRTATGPDTP